MTLFVYPGTGDLLSSEFEPDDTDIDDLTLLNEILNAPSAGGEDEFSQEWQAVFGTTLTPQNVGPGASGDQSGSIADFLPSNLLDTAMRQRMAGGQGNTRVIYSLGYFRCFFKRTSSCNKLILPEQSLLRSRR